ncbi:tricarballylate dehydrogenase [Spirochaetota bacterium]|nr:tricarballylate dehydrogenase [Spirochaetota bacterium]
MSSLESVSKNNKIRDDKITDNKITQPSPIADSSRSTRTTKSSYWDVIVIGSGNAALCSGLSALEQLKEKDRQTSPRVLMLEAAPVTEMGGNSRYTAAALRFAYENQADVLRLLTDYADKDKLARTVFPRYDAKMFLSELVAINKGAGRRDLQELLVKRSYETIAWLNDLGVVFEPIYKRQAYEKEGRYYFWGGLVLATPREGEGLVTKELALFKKLGGTIMYSARAARLLLDSSSTTSPRIDGVEIRRVVDGKEETLAVHGSAVILACGGFEANKNMRRTLMGPQWEHAIVRGTQYNRGDGITMVQEVGAALIGKKEGCHATFMDSNSPDFGLGVDHIDRKNFRKISYPFGIMLNAAGKRFVDEGADFRNYTYAKYGRELLNQPKHLAWQLFDNQVTDLLYAEYRVSNATFVTAATIEELVSQLTDIDKEQALKTIEEYNKSIRTDVVFDPSLRDGKSTVGIYPAKSNWALPLVKPPFLAFKVRCGITFTYYGVKVDVETRVLKKNDEVIAGLYACGEMIGGIFTHNYPGGSGLTAGAVFGKIAGATAATYAISNRTQ